MTAIQVAAIIAPALGLAVVAWYLVTRLRARPKWGAQVVYMPGAVEPWRGVEIEIAGIAKMLVERHAGVLPRYGVEVYPPQATLRSWFLRGHPNPHRVNGTIRTDSVFGLLRWYTVLVRQVPAYGGGVAPATDSQLIAHEITQHVLPIALGRGANPAHSDGRAQDDLRRVEEIIRAEGGAR